MQRIPYQWNNLGNEQWGHTIEIVTTHTDLTTHVITIKEDSHFMTNRYPMLAIRANSIIYKYSAPS